MVIFSQCALLPHAITMEERNITYLKIGYLPMCSGAAYTEVQKHVPAPFN